MEITEQIKNILQPHENGLNVSEIAQCLNETGHNYEKDALDLVLDEMVLKEIIEKTEFNGLTQYRKNEHILKELTFNIKEHHFVLIFIQSFNRRVLSLYRLQDSGRGILPMSEFSKSGITTKMMDLIYDWEDEQIDLEDFLVAWKNENLPELNEYKA